MSKKARKEYHKLINEFLAIHKRPRLTWQQVLELEGGYGKDKIKSVEDAMRPENEGTWPGMWFQSGQKDFSAYQRYDYLYSLLFGRQMISGGTVAHMAKDLNRRWHLEEYHGLVVDWGGSIFTAQDILDLAHVVGTVALVNFEGPQLELAHWYVTGYEPNIYAYSETDDWSELKALVDGHKGPVTWLFSEILEHEMVPIGYFGDIVSELWLNEAYIASSFCTPAYGHHIPVLIGGQEYHTTRTANKAWREAMKKWKWDLTKIKGWNSRLWRAEHNDD